MEYPEIGYLPEAEHLSHGLAIVDTTGRESWIEEGLHHNMIYFNIGYVPAGPDKYAIWNMNTLLTSRHFSMNGKTFRVNTGEHNIHFGVIRNLHLIHQCLAAFPDDTNGNWKFELIQHLDDPVLIITKAPLYIRGGPRSRIFPNAIEIIDGDDLDEDKDPDAVKVFRPPMTIELIVPVKTYKVGNDEPY